MKTFPTTTLASHGGSAIASRFDQFSTDLIFGTTRWKRREHIPDYTAVELAELEITGATQHVRVEFPRGAETIAVSERTVVDVSDMIAVGRHTYAVYAMDGRPFEARLRVTVRRPVVDPSGGTYRVSSTAMRYSRALQLEDDRNAQRVGRFATWVKDDSRRSTNRLLRGSDRSRRSVAHEVSTTRKYRRSLGSASR